MARRRTIVLTLDFLSFSSVIALHYLTSNDQTLTPAKAVGFVYADHPVDSDTTIEAFLDPIFPDSADAWDPLKEAVNYYGTRALFREQASVADYITDFAARVAGERYRSAVLLGFRNTPTDLKTRVSFKYSASRRVYETPFFFVNGFLMSDAESPINLRGWKSVIDPLIASRGEDKLVRPF